ncbi:hypothetical protein CFP56_037568 [Quercus suber]|uniref:Uncharacterized protein n=1 Tax=Quercus suber TaxID=58331 RepID=A0AAW0J503_QUESU
MNVGASTSPFSPNIADTLGDVIIFTAAGDPVFFKDLWDQNQRIAVVALLSFEALWMPFQLGTCFCSERSETKIRRSWGQIGGN